MAGVPRSQRLIAFSSAAAGPSPVWISPDGYITLVKSLFVSNYSGGLITVTLVAHSRPEDAVLVVTSADLATGTTHIWDGWLVLNPTDYVYFDISAGGAVMWLSGAILAGPPQFPPATRQLPLPLPGLPPLPDQSRAKP